MSVEVVGAEATLLGDVKISELVAFLRSVLKGGNFSAQRIERVTLHHLAPGAVDFLAELGMLLETPIATVKVERTKAIDVEVRRVGLLVQQALFEDASRRHGSERYLVLARGPGKSVVGSMLFMFGRAG